MTTLLAAPQSEMEEPTGPDSGSFVVGRLEGFAVAAYHPSVLIVDGYAECAESAATLLELRGYIVRTATTAAAGEKLVRDTRPDVVILDPRLPCGGCDLVTRPAGRGRPPAVESHRAHEL